MVEEAAGGLGATRGQTDMRGLGTAGPGFRLRARRLASGVTGVRLPIGVSRVLCAKKPFVPAASSTNIDVAAIIRSRSPSRTRRARGPLRRR